MCCVFGPQNIWAFDFWKKNNLNGNYFIIECVWVSILYSCWVKGKRKLSMFQIIIIALKKSVLDRTPAWKYVRVCVCVCMFGSNFMFVFQANKITEKRKLILGIGVSFVDSGFYMNSWNRWEFIVYCGVILRLDYRSPTASFIIKSTILVLSLFILFFVWFG